MKKLTDFIVDKRNVILVLFLVLTGLSIYTMQKVKLNYELSEYLQIGRASCRERV